MNVVPKRALGQHFLVDENILGVIGRLSDLQPDDVALEIGPGLGVLTRYLADRIELVHAIEIDRALEDPLTATLAGRTNVRLTFGDALRLDLAALEPPPRKLIANLPYNVATPLVVETLEHVSSLERWCVMVQREIADRFFAEPRTKAYGAVSVLVQLAARKTGFHAVPPTVFRPRPRVESALVAFVRVAGPSLGDVRPVVEAAFAHRRKMLANSIALTGLASRARVEEGLARDRPHRSSTRRGADAARIPFTRGGNPMKRAQAFAKLNLSLVVGPRRNDGKHEVATVLQRIDLVDDIELQPAGALSVEGFADDTLVREALVALAAAADAPPCWRVRIEKRIPVAAGLGGGSSDAAAALLLGNADLPEPLAPEALHAIAARIGADVPFFLREGAQLGSGDGTELAPLDLPKDYHVVLLLPDSESKESTEAVYSRFDERSGAAGFVERRVALLDALAGIESSRDLARLPKNDLVSSPLAEQVEGLGAFRVDVSGAGPTVYGLFERSDDAEHAATGLRPAGRTWVARPV